MSLGTPGDEERKEQLAKSMIVRASLTFGGLIALAAVAGAGIKWG
jgi:hypothetical protein